MPWLYRESMAGAAVILRCNATAYELDWVEVAVSLVGDGDSQLSSGQEFGNSLFATIRLARSRKVAAIRAQIRASGLGKKDFR